MTQPFSQTLLTDHGIELSTDVLRSTLPYTVLALDGTVLFANDALCRLVLLSAEELAGRAATTLCHGRVDMDVVEALLLSARESGVGGVATCELLLKQGQVLTVDITWTLMTGVDGRPWFVTAAVHDETARTRAVRAAELATSTLAAHVEADRSTGVERTQTRRAEQELSRLALHDELTGLPNRALLLDRLEHSLQRDRGRTAVVFVDLDRFTLVNDAQGHALGDALLRTVGERLRANVRPQDTVARFGGDEFVVLADDLEEGAARDLAQHLLDALLPPVTIDGTDFHVAASAGVALSPPRRAADLLRYADTAMHAAKAAGRGRVRVFDLALAEEAEQRFLLGGRLREALGNDTLTMSFQPIVDLVTGQVLGVEALARWHDTERGDVSPEQFVGLAESSGLAAALDRWAINRALSDLRALRSAGVVPLTAYVSVNLSASNLTDPGLEALIVDTVAASALLPGNVMLEITEGAVMREPALAACVLRRLRARGFLLAMDDFGTGHSSLSYLRDLPINVLKVDQSFVAGIRKHSDALAIVASVIDLGRAVGVTVIAEGVEHEEQAVLLRELGCRAAQGWLWSPALTPATILNSLTWVQGYGERPLGDPRQSGRRAPRAEVTAEHGLDRLLSMHRQGASLSTIAAALNRDGYLTPKGLRWHQTSVARAVSDAAYPLLLKTGRS